MLELDLSCNKAIVEQRTISGSVKSYLFSKVTI